MELLARPVGYAHRCGLIDKLAVLGVLGGDDLPRPPGTGQIDQAIDARAIEAADPAVEGVEFDEVEIANVGLGEPAQQQGPHAQEPDEGLLGRRGVGGDFQFGQRAVLAVGHDGLPCHAPTTPYYSYSRKTIGEIFLAIALWRGNGGRSGSRTRRRWKRRRGDGGRHQGRWRHR